MAGQHSAAKRSKTPWRAGNLYKRRVRISDDVIRRLAKANLPPDIASYNKLLAELTEKQKESPHD